MFRRDLAAMALITLVAASCGDGRMGAGEYFAEVEQASAAYDQTTDEVFDLYRDIVADALRDFQTRTADADTTTLIDEMAILLEVTVTEVTSAFEQTEQALAVFVAALGALEPPADVQEAHDTALGALQRSLDAIPALKTSFATVQSLDDISAAINGSAFGDTQPRVTGACLELQRLASEGGVTADLRCGADDE